jgi:hypothetical protein
MKKFYNLAIALCLCLVAFAAQSQNDTVRFKIKAGSEHAVEFMIQGRGYFTIHWGDHRVQEFQLQSGTDAYFSHHYDRAGEFDVIVAAEGLRDTLTGFYLNNNGGFELLSLDARRARNLLRFECCNHSKLETLDLSNSKRLKFANVSGNYAMTELNVSGLFEMEELYMQYSRLTSIDLRGMEKLNGFWGSNSRISEILFDEKTRLPSWYGYFGFDQNALSLRMARNFAEKLNIYFHNQYLPTRYANAKADIELAADTILYSGNQTKVEVYDRDWNLVERDDAYTLTTAFRLSFIKEGFYYVQLSHSDLNGDVAIPYVIGEITNDEIRLTLEGKKFEFEIYTMLQNALFSVDWGDGKIETFDYDGWFEHEYSGFKSYDVVIKALSPGANFKQLGMWGEHLWHSDYYQFNLTALDISRASTLEVLRVNHNKLSTIDISKNPNLEMLKAHSNQLSLREIYKLSTTIEDPNNLFIFPQRLPERKANLNEKLILKNDTVIINGKPTEIMVNFIDGSTAEIGKDYTLSGDTLVFLKKERYDVKLTHSDIECYDRSKDGYVTIPYNVDNVAPESITFTYEGSDIEFYLEVNNYNSTDVLTVDWGNGSTNTYKLNNLNNEFTKDYGAEGVYTITIKMHSFENEITRFDVRHASGNITELDVSNAQSLYSLNVNYHQLASLDLSQNRRLDWVRARGNRIPLPEIRKMSEMLYSRTNHPYFEDLYIFPQNLDIRTVATSTQINLSADTVIIGGKPTDIRIENASGAEADQDDYMLSQGNRIMFLKAGLYFVKLFHESIEYRNARGEDCVTIPFLVGQPNIPEQEIRFKHEQKYMYFELTTALFGSPFSIDWGDGVVETFKGFNQMEGGGTFDKWFEYNYAESKPHEVVIKSLSPTTVFRAFVTWDYGITDIDISKATLLGDLRINHNKLTTIDISKNPELYCLKIHSNLLPLSEVYRLSKEMKDPIGDGSDDRGLFIFPQKLDMRTAEANANVILKNDLITVGNKPTNIEVYNLLTNNSLTEGTHYTLKGDTLVFLNQGFYNVGLNHDSIMHRERHNGDKFLSIPYRVGTIPMDTITFKTENENIHIGTEGSNTILVDWGDGNIDVPNGTWFSRNFAGGERTVTVMAERLTYFYTTSRITELDVSKAPALTQLHLYHNRLKSLDLSRNPSLNWVYAYDNHLSLPEVYKTSLGMTNMNNLSIFNQNLEPRNVQAGTKVLLTNDTVMINNVPTQIYVELNNGNSAPSDNYTLSGDTLTFLKNGAYRVRLYHPDVVPNRRGSVYIPFAVMPAASEPAQISFTWQARASQWKGYSLEFMNRGANYTVNWGNGKTQTITWNGGVEHQYTSAGTYTVTVTAGSTDDFLTYLSSSGNDITSVDVSKAPHLTTLYLDDNKLTTLDVSKNSMLQELDCGRNQLTDLITSNAVFENMNYFTNHRNQFSLKAQYRLATTVIPESANKHFGRQIMPERSVVVNTEFDLSNDLLTVNGTPTRIRVWKNVDLRQQQTNGTGEYANGDEFNISNNKITFTKTGDYQLELFHDSIQFNGRVANVYIPFTVDFSSDATLRSLAVNSTNVNLEAGKFAYTVNVDNAVASANITADANDENATIVSGLGTFALEIGANNRTIVVRADNGTTKTYTITVNRSDGSSNRDLEAQAAIRVFPNPVLDVLHIQTGDVDVPEVKIYNVNGRLLRQVRTKELNMSDLPQGMYFVWINGTTFRVVKR